MKNFWLQVFSENGEPSSKRVLAALIIVVCLAVLVISVVKDGCTECVKDLIQTFIICATTLLGISVVKNIAQPNNNNSNNGENS